MDPVDLILLGVIGFFVFMVMKNTGTTGTSQQPYVITVTPAVYAQLQQQGPAVLQALQQGCTATGGQLSADGMSCTFTPSSPQYAAVAAKWAQAAANAQNFSSQGTFNGNQVTITSTTAFNGL